MPLSVFLWSS